MTESGGYAIMLVETREKKLKLYGCPASRVDLDVADEIVDVNGRSLDNCRHGEIVDYVRRCVLSKTICIRVKQKKVQEPIQNATVQDTFLISVEGQSPKEGAPPLRKEDHVDMTQLSGGHTTSQRSRHAPAANGIVKENRRAPKAAEPRERSAAAPRQHEGISKQQFVGEETINVISVSSKVTELPPAVLEVSGGEPPLPPPVETSSAASDVGPTPSLPITTEPENMTAVQGPVRHREMAVDVPDSFVAVAKTTPRYPPPRKNAGANSENSSLKKNGLYYFSSGSARSRQERSSREGSDSSRRTPPTPRISELVRDRGSSRCGDVTMEMNGGVLNAKDTTENVKNEDENCTERIRKYQEELRKRREEEERLAREEEFLRSSLRGSKKLRALEKKATSETGVENSAFDLEDGDAGITESSHAGKLVGDVPEGQPPELKKILGPSELLDLLHNIESHLQKSNVDEDLVSIEKLLFNSEFQSILTLHNKIQEVCCFKCLPVPVCVDAQDLSQEVISNLEEFPSAEGKELMSILNKLEFEGLMYAHDKVAECQITPEVSPEEELLTRVSQYTEESIKIVRVDKTSEPLGATVKNEGEAVIIGRIVKGGVAEKSGLLHEGDEILEVNGIEMRGKSVNDVCDIMATMSGTLTFLVVPTQYDFPKTLSRETVIHLKAHFDYEPDDDLYIPCRELGMSFQKGDVLHVISQDDPNWWQAYREGEEDQMLAGLIPSKSFQQQREIMKQTIVGDIRERKSKKGKFLCARKHHKKKKKKLYNLNYNDDTDSEQVLTYEEVALYYPRAYHKRPVVLIGPQKVGRHELRQRLMEDTNRFAAAVPHTSRVRRENEVNGVDYHFISRMQFEADILAGRFVEHGEYEKNYYGTSLDAIRSVINAGKTCVLNLHPQSLKILKKSDLKPYVVFIAPPSLEKLRQNCIKAGIVTKEDELKDIIEKAREMEEFFGHYFDMVLINVDTEKTFSQLLHEISVIEREPQWVPAIWIKSEGN